MSDNGRPRFQMFWVLGLVAVLLLVVTIKVGSGRRQEILRPVAAENRRAAGVPAGMRPIAAATATRNKPRSNGVEATVDICGFGEVPVDAKDPFAAGRYIGELASNASNRWLSALLNSGDIRARSAGLFLKDKLAGSGSGLLIEEQTRDALVQLAVGAADPAIYAMAVYACNTYSDSAPTGSCRQITLNTWARLDSDNAVPWLLLAGRAQAKKDAAAEAAAFSQAAKSNKTDAYNFSLYAYSELEMPGDVTPLERWYLSTEVVGIEAATASLHYHAAGKYCSAAAMSDDGIRQQCDALAELFVSKGTNLLDLSIGTNLGARAGWSRERVAGLTETRDALLQAIARATPSSNDDLWTCDGVQRGNAYIGEWVRLGEIGAARETMEHSGLSVSELAQTQRDFMDKIRLNAQQSEESSPVEPTP
jgi:hypothetical protein